MKNIISIAICIISFFCSSQTQYEKEILENRTERNEKMFSEESILNDEEKENFNQLEFFKIDSTYRVTATLIKKKGKRFKMKTSTDRLPEYRQYGVFTFTLNGVKYETPVYQSMSLKGKKEYKNYLFLPINDLTSPDETYGAGRYLDIERTKSNTYILDFNLLYNPYCAYSLRYSCPVTPNQNWLKVRIEAGEKIPNLKHAHD